MLPNNKLNLITAQPYFYALLFFIVSLVFATLTNQTWDDDAIGRYFLTQDAGQRPINFLDSWGRPLFIVLFYLPIKFFGRMGVTVTMSLLTASSGLLLYKAIQKKGVPNAATVVPLLLFQTFLFGISRDAMTEPLASFVVCLGLYLLYSEKYLWFAIVGSLLPLARAEAILLMPFWMLPLFFKKKYFHILLLGTGVGIWWLGWTVYAGTPFAFFHEIFKTGEKVNRYGHALPSHYFSKYVYVLGPVLFFYFVLGFVINIKNAIKDYFIVLQFTVGFLVYVLFASFLDLGQSSGPLRNLITLSPFAAIIALYGLNYWSTLFIMVKKGVDNGRLKAIKAAQKKLVVDGGQLVLDRIMFVGFVIFLLVVGANVFTDKLLLRQSYDTGEKDYIIFSILCVCAFLSILAIFLSSKYFFSLVGILMVLQFGFTLFFESPQSHANDERIAMADMTAFIKTGFLANKKVYCNHPWFFWSAGAVRLDSTKYGPVDPVHVRDMLPGEILLWEPHYTIENYGNIPLAKVTSDTTLVPFYYIDNEKGELWAMAFIKRSHNLAQDMHFFQTVKSEHKPNSSMYYLAGRFEATAGHDFPTAIKSLTAAINLKSLYPDAILERAICYLNINDRTDGMGDLKTAASQGSVGAYDLLRKLSVTDDVYNAGSAQGKGQAVNK